MNLSDVNYNILTSMISCNLKECQKSERNSQKNLYGKLISNIIG